MASLAVTVAGLLPAAKWEVHLGTGRAGVDVDDPCLEVAHRAERLVDVASEDTRRQAVASLVERKHRRTVVVDRDDRQDGPEDLLLADPVHRADAGEDRGLEEEAVGEVAAARATAPDHELALAAPDPHIR